MNEEKPVTFTDVTTLQINPYNALQVSLLWTTINKSIIYKNK